MEKVASHAKGQACIIYGRLAQPTRSTDREDPRDFWGVGGGGVREGRTETLNLSGFVGFGKFGVTYTIHLYILSPTP